MLRKMSEIKGDDYLTELENMKTHANETWKHMQQVSVYQEPVVQTRPYNSEIITFKQWMQKGNHFRWIMEEYH